MPDGCSASWATAGEEGKGLRWQGHSDQVRIDQDRNDQDRIDQVRIDRATTTDA